MFPIVTFDENSTPHVIPGWEKTQGVRWYLREKHFNRGK